MRDCKKMVLADKIMNERKKKGWSQEQLVNKLGVSRQSVSKWESAQSMPDINRILELSKLFGISTDYLLKDEIDNKVTENIIEPVEFNEESHIVSMEDAIEFLDIQQKIAPKIALGVSLCILSPVLLIVLFGLSDSGIFGISETLASGAGITVLLVMVAIGVFLFIICNGKAEKYDFLEKEKIAMTHDVNDMVLNRKNEFAGKFHTAMAVGVMLCILSCVPLLISTSLYEETAEYMIMIMVGILLIIIAIAVNIFVRVGIIKGNYDKLLQQGDYTVNEKKTSPIINRISGIYWLLITAVYLVWSFKTSNWGRTWLIWPVAGVLFGVIETIAKIILKAED